MAPPAPLGNRSGLLAGPKVLLLASTEGLQAGPQVALGEPQGALARTLGPWRLRGTDPK